LPLHARAVQADRGSLYTACLKYIGSWDEGLRLAGFDPEKIRYPQANRHPRGYWSRERIAEKIRKLHEAGVPLHTEHMKKTNGKLLAAAEAYFGSWKAALESAGIDYDSVRRTTEWTRDRVLLEILRAYVSGEDISFDTIRKSRPDLMHAVKRFFESYEAAVEAAGIDYSSVSKLARGGREQVLAEIRWLYEIGADLHRIPRSSNRSLYLRALSHFGSWQAALDAADIETPVNPGLKWGNRIAEIRKRKGISRDQLARLIGHKTDQQVRAIERGIHQRVELSTLLKIAEALEEPFEKLFFIKEE